ncbi:hypothetical protein [Rhodococcus koreensis]|uniref:hypothetical protein n=1 Tax=Rhodococcus koreensis TaxID=99653 RepID=UPI0036DCD4B9
MSQRNIIDEIDSLVDAQLEQEPSGYDHNINQDRCPHCGRDWHGLKITERMEEMRRRYHRRSRYFRDVGEEDYAESVLDPGYRYAEDDSDVICPGSEFIGPWATKSQLSVMQAWRERGTGGFSVGWSLPDDPLDPSQWLGGFRQRFMLGFPPEVRFPRASDTLFVTAEDFTRYDYSVGAPVFINNYSARYEVGRVQHVEEVDNGRRIYLDRPLQRPPHGTFFVYEGNPRTDRAAESPLDRAWASLLRTMAALDSVTHTAGTLPQLEGIETEGETGPELVHDGEPRVFGRDFLIGPQVGPRDFGHEPYSLSAVQAARRRMRETWLNPVREPQWTIDVGDEPRSAAPSMPQEGDRVAFVMSPGGRIEGTVTNVSEREISPGITRCSITISQIPSMTARRWLPGDPVPEMPQQQALPRPSHTPPMWANNPTRQNRRRNR